MDGWMDGWMDGGTADETIESGMLLFVVCVFVQLLALDGLIFCLQCFWPYVIHPTFKCERWIRCPRPPDHASV
jgi:hypothetical protein